MKTDNGQAAAPELQPPPTFWWTGRDDWRKNIYQRALKASE
jgi:hypothetical protein